MAVWVIAVEYAGSDVSPAHPGARRPTVEHAFDLDTGTFAHGPDRPRVAFTEPVRGWPTASVRLRCAACALAVTAAVSSAVAVVVRQAVADLGRWATTFTDTVAAGVWLTVSPTDPPPPPP